MCQWELTALFSRAATLVLWVWLISEDTDEEVHGWTVSTEKAAG